MAIEVMIKRKVKQGHKAKELVPLILQMRAIAMQQDKDAYGRKRLQPDF